MSREPGRRDTEGTEDGRAVPPGRARRLTTLVLVGAAAGLLSGAFGVGGGVLVVPALVLLLGVGQRLAHGTSLAAVVPIAVTGAAGYLARDGVDLLAAALLAAGTVVGAQVGARLLDRLPLTALKWAFVAFMLAAAAGLVWRVPDRDGVLEIGAAVAVALVALGLVTGVLSAVLGVGGGVFIVPVLVLALEASDVVAKGTSLLVIVPTGIVATLVSRRRGNVDLQAALAIGVSGAATSLAGVALAVWLAPRPAAILFALLLAVLAVRLALQRRRE